MLESAISHVFDRLLFRKAYHLLCGGLALVANLVLDPPFFSVLAFLYLIVFRVWGKRISFAALGILVLSLFCPRNTTFGAVLVWVLGDGMAALVGNCLGRTKWPWSAQKTLEGSLAFFICSFLALLTFLTLSRPWTQQLLFLAISVSLAGCLAEVLPITFIGDREPSDNLAVLLTSGFVLRALSLLLNVPIG